MKMKGDMYSDNPCSASGVKAAQARNPNKDKDLNPAPCGPYSVSHAEPGSGGMEGDAEVKARGGPFHFK